MLNFTEMTVQFPVELTLFVIILMALIPIVSTLIVILSWYYTTSTLPSHPKKPRHVLITGGSKGLGLGIAQELVAQGTSVTIAARGKEALDRSLQELKSLVPKDRKDVFVQGWTVDASDFNQVVGMLKKCNASPAGPLDWIIANAGTSLPGFMASTLPCSSSTGLVRQQMQANYLTAATMAEAMIALAKEGSADSQDSVVGIDRPHLYKLPQRLVLVGSVLSLMSFIGYSAYSGSYAKSRSS